MKILDWFKPKDKRNVVLPSARGALSGVELIRAFSVGDEPKVKNFPKDQYKVFWEIVVKSIPGGYSAAVRFYPFEKGVLSEHQLNDSSLENLRRDVSALIRKTMDQNKR